MKEAARELAYQVGDLLEFCLKTSQRHNLDEVFIANGRARDLVKLANQLKKELKKS